MEQRRIDVRVSGTLIDSRVLAIRPAAHRVGDSSLTRLLCVSGLLALLIVSGCASPPVVDKLAPTAERAACYQPSCCNDTTALRFEPHRVNCRAIALANENKSAESLLALQAAIAAAKAETIQKAAATEVLCFTLNDAAHRADARGSDAESRALFDGNFAACKARFGDTSDTAAQALYGGASQHIKRDRLAVAQPQIEQVIAWSRANGNRGLESFATDALGRIKDQQGDRAEGRRLLRESIAIKTAVFGVNSRELAVSYTNLGASYVEANEGATGREWYRRAIETYSAALGETDEQTLDVESTLAASHLADGELKQAEQLYAVLLPKFVGTFGATDERTVVIINDWGAALARQNRYAEALVKFEQSLAIRRGTVPNSLRHGYSALNAAKMKNVSANCAAAEALSREARSVANANNTPAQRNNAEAAQLLADVLAFEQECALPVRGRKR